MHFQRSFGFNASRSQSPSKLTDSTRTANVNEGKITTHHTPENRNSLPTQISVPRDGLVGGIPTPRNERVASIRIAIARLMVAITNTGPITFGNTWRKIIINDRRPAKRAAKTYSRLRSAMVEPRTVRAYCTQVVTAIAKIKTTRAAFSCISRGSALRTIPLTKSATRIVGKLNITSAMRMKIASSIPPK